MAINLESKDLKAFHTNLGKSSQRRSKLDHWVGGGADIHIYVHVHTP